jgi:SAM-dependent methyltransferase
MFTIRRSDIRHAYHTFKRDVLGINNHLYTEDRRVLEQIIFPFFIRSQQYHTVLFVGCQWYTRSYNRSFEQRHDFWTLEPNHSQRKYGAKQHVIDSLQNLRRSFKDGSFDLIFCNGVIGFGLDTMSDAEQAFQACYNALCVGGVLVIGWNDIARRRPFELDQCRSLGSFKSFIFPPFGASIYKTNTPNRHTYNFYEK